MPRAPSARQTGRIDLLARDINLPGAVEIGSYHYKTAQRALHAVVHEGCFGICHLARGHQTYRVDGELCRLKGGDQLLTFPGEVLDTAGTPEEKGHLYWLIFRMQPLDAPLLFLEPKAACALRRILLGLPQRCFTADLGAKELVADLLHALQQRPVDMQPRLAVAQQLQRYLFMTISAAQCGRPPLPSPRIQRCLEHIAAHLHEPLHVPQLAQLIGLSESRFKTRFRAEVGVPPGDYVLRSKIEAAQHSLALTGSSVTHVAHALGFSSSQYFATVFRRFTGTTPSAHRMSSRRQ